MSLLERLGTDGSSVATIAISTLGVYALVVLLTRLAGPRSLAKMSSFDFAATVAVGSTLASTAVGSVSLAEGGTGLVLLFGAQALVGVLRRRGMFAGGVDNRPLLLMAGAEVLDRQLRQARISRSELYAQLRLAGVQRLTEVHAVVLETNGDLSVLTADRGLDEQLLEGVRGRELLA